MKIKSILMIVLLTLSLGLNSFSQKISFSDLKEEADQVNAACPTMVDNVTRLDKCEAIPDSKDLIIQYTYTITSIQKLDVLGKIDQMRDFMDKTLAQKIKESDDLIRYKENNIIFIFVYYDKYHNFLFNIKLTPDKYKNTNLYQ
jgi:hypothetical protein